LLDAAEGLRIVQRELEKPRQAQASNTRDTLLNIAHSALVLGGRLEEARRLRMETDVRLDVGSSTPGGDDVYSLDWATAEQTLRDRADHYSRSGNLLCRQFTAEMLGRLLTRMGETEKARRAYDEAISLASGRMLPQELFCRAHLAVIDVEAGHLDQAHRHVTRCEEVAAQGNGLRTYGAALLVARGGLAAAEGRLDEANRVFAEAVDINRRTSRPWWTAEAFHDWGRALLAADDREGAVHRLDGALEVYSSIGVGSPWTDGVVADRRRAE
jgi:tetratricopeptide (TPR) repeat protein